MNENDLDREDYFPKPKTYLGGDKPLEVPLQYAKKENSCFNIKTFILVFSSILTLFIIFMEL